MPMLHILAKRKGKAFLISRKIIEEHPLQRTKGVR
jgi:hypothetical protein